MEELIGHTYIRDFFQHVIAEKRLVHAYCFVGQTHIGKRTFAEVLGAEILQIPRVKFSTHPDQFVIEPGMDEKTGQSKKDIIIDQIHDARSFLSQRPYWGTQKVAIVDQAHRMNAHASNALLKTLEEPRPGTLMIVLTPDEELLPVTIRSRCQMMYFQPVKKDLIFSTLREKGIEEHLATDMTDASFGLPGLALEWAEQPEKFLAYKKEQQRFLSFIGKPFHEQLASIDELFGDKTDHIQTREKLLDVLRVWRLELRAQLFPETRAEISVSMNRIPAIDRSILDAVRALQQNVHPRLLIERILFLLS